MASQPISQPDKQPPSPYVLLSVGARPELLRLRNELLRNAGYHLHSETSVSEALHLFVRRDFDLVIMCHSVPEEEKLRALAAVKKAAPSTPVVIVGLDGEAAWHADGSVHSLDGPDALLECVADLLTEPGTDRNKRHASL